MALQVHNVLTQPAGTVYLNEPMNKNPELDDKTDPQDAPESDEATPAPQSMDDSDEKDVKYKKRYDDLKRHYDTTKTSFESQISDLKAQLTDLTSKVVSESSFKAPKTKEETKAFIEKYPDLAENIMSLAGDVFSKTSSVIEDRLKKLEEKTNSISSQHGIEELKKYHPDFEQIKDDPRFHDWFNRQAQEVKNLIRSTNPQVIAKGLDMYKQFAGIKPKAETKKDATREVKVPSRVQIGEPGKRTYTNAEIYKMSDKEFEKLQEDIIAAQYDGRIVG